MLPKVLSFLKNERTCLYFTAIIVVSAILIGDLDMVAPITTIFFLQMYGGVNVACYLLDYLGSPNWRPKWKYHHKSTSFIGMLLCFTMMVVTSYLAALAALGASTVMYLYLERKS